MVTLVAEVIATPLSVRVPVLGAFTVTCVKALAGESPVSEKPKSAAVTV